MRRRTLRVPNRRLRIAATISAIGIVFAATAGTSANAIEVVQGGSVVTGTITSGTYHLPVVGACVYPYLSGLVKGESALVGDYYVHESFAGGCSDSTGQFSVTLPPTLAPNLPALSLLVVPANTTAAAVMVPADGSLNISLPNATGTASGFVTENGTPLKDVLVKVEDATNKVIGMAVTSNTGYWYAGVTGMSAVQATARPIGVVGASLSDDLISAALQEVQAGLGINAVFPDLVLPPTMTLKGRVMADASTPHSWQVIHADCVENCSSSVVATTDENGYFTMSAPASAKMIVGFGSQLARMTFYAGTVNVGTVQTVPSRGPEIGYRQAPTTWFAPRSLVHLNGTVDWAWSGGTLESAPYEFKYSRALASYNKALGAYSDWVTNTSGSDNAKLARGASECVRVKTITVVRGIESTTQGAVTTQCQTVPLDERALSASRGWHQIGSAGAYNRTLETTTTTKATLTLTGVTGRQLAVVYASSDKGGSFTVSINGKVIKTVSTRAAKGLQQQVNYGPIKAMKNAKVVITTTSSKPVTIDGLAVLP